MRGDVSDFLDRLYREGRAFDAGQPDRLDRRRNLEPDSAALLGVLIRALRPATVLEIGTSNGYSTIWLADAAADVGARVTTVELDPARSATARANLNLASAGDPRLPAVVDFVVADAAEYLRAATGPVDLVLLDAERPAYPEYWPHLLRILRPAGGLLVVDNVLSHADQVTSLRALVDAEPSVTSTVASVGAGLLLVVRN